MEITVNFPEGAIQVNQVQPTLQEMNQRISHMEEVIEAMRVKLETLVPDTEQLNQMVEKLRTQSDALQSVVEQHKQGE